MVIKILTMRILFTTAALLAAKAAAETIVLPPINEGSSDIAIVWIHGMDCENTAYVQLAQEVQL